MLQKPNVHGDDVSISNETKSPWYSSSASPGNIAIDWFRNRCLVKHDKQRSNFSEMQQAVKDSFVGTQQHCDDIFKALESFREEPVKSIDGHQLLVRQMAKSIVGQLEGSQQRLADNLHKLEDCLEQNLTYMQEMWEELARTRYQSLTDDFTGMPNRRAFMEKLQEEIGRAERYDFQFAFALIDLDKFKTINDTYGHAAGDKVLFCYATEIFSEIRNHDFVARYGGEEFAVLFPNTGKEGAYMALNNMSELSASLEFEIGPDIRIRIPTFSAGLTIYTPGETAESLISRADKALYRAKDLGRDRIEVN